MSKSSNLFDIPDSNWAISDISGMKFPASEGVYGAPPEQGLFMHISEYSEYNPQYKISPHPDNTNVKNARPRPEDTFSTERPTFE